MNKDFNGDPMERIFQLGFFFFALMIIKVDMQVPQVMHYMLHYEKLISLTILGKKTKFRKRFVSYFKNNGITTLKKHIHGDHYLIARKFEEKINNNAKSLVKLKQPTKKRSIVSAHVKSLNSLDT
jgi:hypothetical protein